MADRFDLEQQILQTWTITDDLELFLDLYDAMSEDERMNFLIGLTTIYNAKFTRMFDTFEQLVNAKNIV